MRVVSLSLLMVSVACGSDGLPFSAGSYEARDSLAIGEEPSADARRCLDGLVWEPTTFPVTVEKPHRDEFALVRFPSPIATGDSTNDLVAMEWYRARQANEVGRAPAVVVVHESGRGMNVGRLLAKAFAQQGVQSFLLQLPTYGVRKSREPGDASNVMALMRQGIADVRRAYDVAAALPGVDRERIALQGTSLGGMVAATSASLDGCYDRVFLLLAGGNLYDLIKNGKRDAANTRRDFERLGITDEQLQEMASVIEPTRIAHRIGADRTWLYSGTKDTVVPPANSLALAKAARLDDSHHIRFNADHYSGVIFLPLLILQMADEIHGRPRTPRIEP